jgi:hypothetical protein
LPWHSCVSMGAQLCIARLPRADQLLPCRAFWDSVGTRV